MAAFGRYEILERLAIGGMAEVYRARAWGTGGFSKDVVIKKILPGFSSDPEFRSLFIHEARISSGLTHSRITQVLDFGIMDGSYFIAMELVDGPNLGELLGALRKEFTRMPLAAAVHVLGEVLEGLDYAHRRTGPDGKSLSIVHRDISPHNVLLSREGEVKLTDFGIARAEGSPSMTRVGRVRGKPQYMSPEQIRGMPLDGRSDLFACGLVFYEILTGFPPYAAADDNAIMNAILRGEVEPASARVKEVPRAIDAVVERALHLDPDRRFATAAEFRQALLDVAYAYRLHPDAEALGALVRKHFAGSPERAPVAPSMLVDRTGEDGELGRFSTSTSSVPVPVRATSDTAESERGPVAPADAVSSRESTVALPLPSTLVPEATAILPPRPVPPASAPPGESRQPVLPGGLVPLGLGFLIVVAGSLILTTVGGREARRVASLPTPTPASTPETPVLVPSIPPVTAIPVAAVTVVRAPSPVRPPTRTPTPTPRAIAKPGTLSLNSRPWGEVTIDGRAVGPTPLVDHPLPPGTYSIVITNAGAGLSEKFSVTIESGRPVRRAVELH